jgi:hypothetical protein
LAIPSPILGHSEVDSDTLQTAEALDWVTEVDVVNLDVASYIQLRGVGLAGLERLPADDCNAHLASFALDFCESKAGCASGAAGHRLVVLDGGLDGCLLGGRDGDHLHDGSICRPSVRGDEKGERTRETDR